LTPRYTLTESLELYTFPFSLINSHTVEQAGTVLDNAAKSFGRSASLDAAGSEQGAELCATAASNTSQHLLNMTDTYISQSS